MAKTDDCLGISPTPSPPNSWADNSAVVFILLLYTPFTLNFQLYFFFKNSSSIVAKLMMGHPTRAYIDADQWKPSGLNFNTPSKNSHLNHKNGILLFSY